MTDDNDIEGYVQTIPTELFLHILTYLTPPEFMKCRGVCLSWKSIVDEILCKKDYWLKLCKRDYSACYLLARKKAKMDMNWYYIYRTLCVWPRVPYAMERSDEFASAARLLEEVRSVEVLGNNMVAVHNKSGVQFYDASTLKLLKRSPIIGDYARYTENKDSVIIQNYHLHLYVLNKKTETQIGAMTTCYSNVKLFYLKGKELYYVKLNDEIYVADLSERPYKTKFIKRAADLDGVMSLGYKDGGLNVLTYQRNIYTITNHKMVYKQSLSSEPNLLNVLHRYNFLEQLDWRVYFQWMYVLRHTMPEGSMRDIICIRPYGDIYFVGSNFGVLCIFHKPYTNGQLDIFKTEPLLQINFMERSDIPVLATCPILNIDLMELDNGHVVYVAMPKKVAVLKFTHKYMHPVSWTLEPDDDIQIKELQDY